MGTIILALAVLALAYIATRQGAGAIPVASDEPTYLPTPSPTPAPAMMLPGGHNEWDNQIRYAAYVAGLPMDAGPLAIKAIIEHESAHTWNPEVVGDYDLTRCPQPYERHPSGWRPGFGYVSTAGYCSLGLMQIHRYWHPSEARNYDLLDGNQNILAGAYLVASLWRTYSGDWDRVLAAYNGGPAAGSAYPSVTAQVRNYVANVGGTLQRYAGEAGVAV